MTKLVLLALVAACSTSPDGAFYVRNDARECAAPTCGGAWIRAADGQPFTCPTAITNAQNECYVGTLSAEPTDLLQRIADNPVDGHFTTGIVVAGKDFGTFVVTDVR